MLFDDVTPKRWHAIEWYAFLLFFLYIWHNAAPGLETNIALFVIGSMTIILLIGHQVRLSFYSKHIWKLDNDEPARPRTITGNVFSSETVRINPEQQMAKHILMQIGQGFAVDLTEKYWVLQKHYVNVGFSSPEEWRETMSRWESAGAVRRKNPNASNSERLVGSKPALVRAAGGQRLSAPPPHSQ